MKSVSIVADRLASCEPRRRIPRLARELATARDLAAGPGLRNVLAVISWLTGRRDVRVRTLAEVRRRWDELVELRDAELGGSSVWARRRTWGWS